MLLTETEAKQQWCPLARVALTSSDRPEIHGAPGGVNRSQPVLGADPVQDYCRCMGSRCMAWRWGESLREGGPYVGRTIERGYCGAFGDADYLGGSR